MGTIYDSKNINELETFCAKVSKHILNNKLSLYVGAGSSVQYGGADWASLFPDSEDYETSWSELDKAQSVELNGSDIKQKIASSLIEFNNSVDTNLPETYLNNLLSFKLASIWTTNYDNIIENILVRNNIEFKTIFEYADFNKLFNSKDLCLIKINGSAEKSSSIVVTREDFIKFKKEKEGFLILFKRDLLCNNFLFIGTSFADDILRFSIKDILYCLNNGYFDYSTQHYAIITNSNKCMLEYLSKDISKNYNINCLKVNSPKKAYLVTDTISLVTKMYTIFVSGAKNYIRHSIEETEGKLLTTALAKIFSGNDSVDECFKIVSGMGTSIGNFICGAIKKIHSCNNIDRYLQMEPFPFDSKEGNDAHRKKIMNYAGIFLFVFGDININQDCRSSGVWREYIYAKEQNGLIVPIPMPDTVGMCIFKNELNDTNSFTYKYENELTIDKDFDGWENYFTRIFNLLVQERKALFNKKYNNILIHFNPNI